ncbi:Rrf2 family transcriptional regulator [Patulibacter defluvii]|uniref:Rrf2 family transcriptional regulator n=1 Tax=Patulibacter defluvii TaxID=3095358 RepID=UPI002A747E3E|nr:Rrf2 family transcriptional regulator [Patulibacter sp. DM4]
MARPTNTRFAVGVHLMTLLAAQPDAVQSSTDLAGSVGTNPVHVRRVLGLLRDAGLVASRPGTTGGWRVTRPPREIALADVWRAVHGDGQVLGLHEANPDCAAGQRIQRALVEVDRRAARAIEDELGATTLADLAAGIDQLAVVAPSA